MRKIITLIALFIGFLNSNGQNIQVTNVAFTQTLLPKTALPDNIATYRAVITTPYLKDDSTFRQIAEDKYQADLKKYPETVKEAQKYFDEVTLKEHAQKVAEAKEKYKLENEAFEKMSKLEKLALMDKRPELNIPQRPTFVYPPKPVVETINTADVIIFNPQTLAENYIKIEGFGEDNSGLKIKIDFKGFDYIEPVASVVNVENYNPQTREKFITKQTQFVTKYRHPVNLEIKIGNEVIKTGTFGETGVYQVLTTSTKPNRLLLERQFVESTLRDINNYLNQTYAYTKVTRQAAIYYVKNKKGEYDDVEKAKDFASSGYKNYTANTAEAVKDLENAISIWEKVISEANYDDSKARIDEKVGTAMLKNIIFATIIVNDFEKTDKYITDYNKLRLSYEDKQYMESLQRIYNDLKSRATGK